MDIPGEHGFETAQRPARKVVPSTAGWRSNGPKTTRHQFVAGIVLVLCCATGSVAGLVLLIRRPVDPLFVSVPIGEYASPGWPINSWADQDAELLVSRFSGPGGGTVGVKAFSYQQSDRLRALLDWVAGAAAVDPELPNSDRHRPLILHITALAATRGGRVYLLAGDARPDDPTPGPQVRAQPSGWLDVQDVLAATAAWPGRHKFLILDLAHPTADPFGGLLRDEVALRLDEWLKETPPEFPVLTSCGPGQMSLPADPARCSAFAMYLAEGLGGAADGYGFPPGRDGEVSVRELAAFTAARVDRWARLTHGRRQVPVLYGPTELAANFVLSRKASWRVPPPEAPGGYPDWLQDGWGLGDATSRGPGVQTARLKAGLLLAEELWLRPGPTQRAEDVWARARDEWNRHGSSAIGREEQDWASLSSVAERLRVAQRGKPAPSLELAKALDTFLTAKPEQEQEAEKSWTVLASPAPAAAVQMVWARACETDRPTPEMLARWARAAGLANPVMPFAETRSLRILADRGTFRRQKLAMFPAAAVAALIIAEDELGRVAALGPDEFPVAGRIPADGLANFRAGRDLLFTADTSAQVAEAAATLVRAQVCFALARSRIERCREARRSLSSAVLALGDTLPGVIASARPSTDVWMALAEAATKFDGIDLATAGPEEVTALIRGTAAIRDGFDAKALERLAGKDRRHDVEAVEKLREALAVGGDLGPARKVAWDALLADTAALHAAVRERDASDDMDRALTSAPGPDSSPDPETGRALRRAEGSIRLLQLASAPTADQAKELLRRTRTGGPANWDALGRCLADAWLKDLPARARSSSTPAEIERIRRIVTPGLARYEPWSGAFPTPPRSDYPMYKSWAEGLAQFGPQGGTP